MLKTCKIPRKRITLEQLENNNFVLLLLSCGSNSEYPNIENKYCNFPNRWEPFIQIVPTEIHNAIPGTIKPNRKSESIASALEMRAFNGNWFSEFDKVVNLNLEFNDATNLTTHRMFSVQAHVHCSVSRLDDIEYHIIYHNQHIGTIAVA